MTPTNAYLTNKNVVLHRSYMIRRHLNHFQGVLNQNLKSAYI